MPARAFLDRAQKKLAHAGIFILAPFYKFPPQTQKNTPLADMRNSQNGNSYLYCGGTEAVKNLQWGTHACQMFKAPEEMLEIVIPYLRQGLARNELCLVICDWPDIDRLLKENIPGFSDYASKNQIQVIAPRTKNNGNGSNDAVFFDKLKGKYDHAVSQGLFALRVVNITDGFSDNSAQRELSYSSFVRDRKASALCCYPPRNYLVKEIIDISKSHGTALVKRDTGWEAIANDLQNNIQKTLAEKESLLQTFLENTPEPICVKDTKGRMILANQAMVKITGKPFELVAGKNAIEYFGLTAGEKIMAHDRMVVETGKNQVFEETIPTVNGDKIFLSSKSPFRDITGRIIGIFIILRDISPLKENEQKLRSANERLVLAQNFARAGIWDWDLATDKLNWSPELFRLFGLDPEKQTADFSTWQNILHPDDRQTAQKRIEDAITNHTPLRNEYRIILPNGVIRWIIALGNTAYGENGQAARMLGICLDATERKKAETELNAAKERYQNLFNSMTEGFSLNEIIFDGADNPVDYRIIDANTAFAHYVGLKREDILGKLRSSILPSNPTSLARYAQVVKTGQPDYFENYSRYLDKYNKIYVYRTAPRQFAMIFSDITREKKSENDLRASEEKYRNLVKYAPAAIYEITLDGNRFLSVNDVMCNITGYTREELLLINPNDLLDSESLNAFRGRVKRKIAGEKIDENIEYRVKKKNGNYLHAIINVGAFRQSKEKIQSVVVIAYDITERKIMEETLRRNEERSRQIADTMPNIVWVAGADGTIAFVNRTFKTYTGMARHGTRIDSFLPLHYQDRHATEAACKNALEKGIPYQIEHRVRRYDNEYIWHLSRGVPVRDGQGRVVNWYGTATDIHEIKLAQKNLQRTDEEKNKFISMMSHELRNPLTPIVTGIELIRSYINEPHPDAETLKKMIDEPARIIDEQTKNITRLLDDLLDISRISRGKIDLKKQPVLVKETLEMAVRTVLPLIEKQQHELVVSLPDEKLFVKADPVRLQQIVINLLNNAIKYTPPKGKIELQGISAGREAWIIVRDNGIGLDQETANDLLSSIVETRAATPFVSTQGEMGIGLKLTKDLVRLHNGLIQVDSGGIDKGCEFIVRLPALDYPPPVNPHVHSTSQKNPRKLNILVVDDDINIAKLISKALVAFGHNADIRLNGSDAIALAKTNPPDIALVDIGLPGMHGFEVLQALRQIEKEKSSPIKIAAITGYGQKEDKELALSQGFDMHLAKPITMDDLKKAIACLAEKQVPCRHLS